MRANAGIVPLPTCIACCVHDVQDVYGSNVRSSWSMSQALPHTGKGKRQFVDDDMHGQYKSTSLLAKTTSHIVAN